MRVLIADDQRSFATALAEMVRYCGHEVVAIVGSGLEAIHGFTFHKPDLILMDYRMPKLNGATACRHILAKDPTARIVLVSAWSPLDGADESGAMCFLPKPVDLARLNATLLTISQSMPTLAFGDNINPFPTANLPASSSDFPTPIPIPQEIISPIEHFPIENFPAAGPVELRAVSGDEKVSSDKPRRRKTRPPRDKRATDH
jgi:two-component system chemotaxis response regulator CheY